MTGVDVDGAERKRIFLPWLFAREEEKKVTGAIVVLGTVHCFFFF